jgi:AbrB family looped-hinge helix DNA binding protein
LPDEEAPATIAVEGFVMSQITKLSTKGQIPIPKAIRTARRWKPGMEFVIQETDEGVLLKPKKEPKREGKTLTVDDLIGIIPYKGPRRSIREMDEGVMREARKHG